MLKSFILLYIGMVAIFFVLADFFMFQPPHTHLIEDSHTLKLQSASGKKITAVYLQNPTAKYTILLSHGNAEDLFTLRPFLERLRQQGFSVLAYDYQGYSTSEGLPTEKNTYQAIDAAYDYLTKQANVPPSQIILYGRSLGSGPTVDLATRVPVKAVILESPFMSAYRTLTQIPLILFDKFNNISKIDNIKVPVLVLQGTRDRVVPHWQGKKIFAEIKSPKEGYWIDGAGHNNIPEVAQDAYWNKLSDFANSLDSEVGNHANKKNLPH